MQNSEIVKQTTEISEVIIKLKGGTTESWKTVNPILSDNEMGIETDTETGSKQIKIGDGVNNWNSLEYFTGMNEDGYEHPLTHSIDMIVESATKKIMTNLEREKLESLEVHPESHSADMIDTTIDKQFVNAIEKADIQTIPNIKIEISKLEGKIEGVPSELENLKLLLEEKINDGGITLEEREKLASIESGATKYTSENTLADVKPYVDDKISKEVSRSNELIDDKVSKVVGKDLSTNDYTDEEKLKLSKLQELPISSNDVVENESRRFVTDEEKAKWNSGTGGTSDPYVHPATHSIDIITESETGKVMTNLEREKLSGIEDGANKYTGVEALTDVKPYIDNLVSSESARIDGELINKVEKVDGKGLSSSDYTLEEKTKLTELPNITDDDVERWNSGTDGGIDTETLEKLESDIDTAMVTSNEAKDIALKIAENPVLTDDYMKNLVINNFHVIGDIGKINSVYINGEVLYSIQMGGIGSDITSDMYDFDLINSYSILEAFIHKEDYQKALDYGFKPYVETIDRGVVFYSVKNPKDITLKLDLMIHNGKQAMDGLKNKGYASISDNKQIEKLMLINDVTDSQKDFETKVKKAKEKIIEEVISLDVRDEGDFYIKSVSDKGIIFFIKIKYDWHDGFYNFYNNELYIDDRNSQDFCSLFLSGDVLISWYKGVYSLVIKDFNSGELIKGFSLSRDDIGVPFYCNGKFFRAKKSLSSEEKNLELITLTKRTTINGEKEVYLSDNDNEDSDMPSPPEEPLKPPVGSTKEISLSEKFYLIQMNDKFEDELVYMISEGTPEISNFIKDNYDDYSTSLSYKSDNGLTGLYKGRHKLLSINPDKLEFEFRDIEFMSDTSTWCHFITGKDGTYAMDNNMNTIGSIVEISHVYTDKEGDK